MFTAAPEDVRTLRYVFAPANPTEMQSALFAPLLLSKNRASVPYAVGLTQASKVTAKSCSAGAVRKPVVPSKTRQSPFARAGMANVDGLPV